MQRYSVNVYAKLSVNVNFNVCFSKMPFLSGWHILGHVRAWVCVWLTVCICVCAHTHVCTAYFPGHALRNLPIFRGPKPIRGQKHTSSKYSSFLFLLRFGTGYVCDLGDCAQNEMDSKTRSSVFCPLVGGNAVSLECHLRVFCEHEYAVKAQTSLAPLSRFRGSQRYDCACTPML